MTVRVLLFAAFREAAGADRLEREIGTGETVGSLWEALVEAHPELDRWTPSAAVNEEWARRETPLTDGDEIAFLPPVSGG